MFATISAICILLSIFAHFWLFFHFVKTKLHCFQPIRIEKFFHNLLFEREQDRNSIDLRANTGN